MSCAKQTVMCHIKLPDGRIFGGQNICLNPQTECPREDGEGYDKCKTICVQLGHAEEEAIRAALSKGVDLKGATAIITGHTRVCDSCRALLNHYDIVDIIFSKGVEI